MTVETREHTLEDIARALVAPGRGILAADESTGTITRRLVSIGVEATEDNRRAWRQLLFSTQGAGEYISGVILYDETLRQSADDGRPFVDVLRGQDIIPGIKVDLGAKQLAGADGEQVTEGPRRPPRAPRRVRQAGCEVHQVARRHRHWRPRAVRLLHSCQRTRPGALRRAVAGGRPCSYCRARSADGWGPRYRPLPVGDGAHAPRRLRRAGGAAGVAGGHVAQAEHGALRRGRSRPGRPRRGSGGDNRVLQADGARRRPRHRLPFRRPVRRRGDGEPERDEPRRARLPLGAQLLLWPWPAGHAPGDVGRQAGERARGQQAFLDRARQTSAAREGKL